ncbi:MAG TPA: PEP/pyruvate-binding domain-containing protein [Vicinamibacterales bacterium]|nr:PEP/pyruvate-binding domain-containing protein [Vicinamibacterales bacterium]
MSRDPCRAYFIGGQMPPAAFDPAVVGGKAANLARLQRLGLPVPPALALTTDLARAFMRGSALPAGLRRRIAPWLRGLEHAASTALGAPTQLVVSIRSSPPKSMPGMLGTVLDAGMNEDAVAALIRQTGSPWLAWDTYRRFIRSFAERVRHCPAAPFERIAAEHLAAAGAETLQDLDPISMRSLARASAARFEELTGAPLPRDRVTQVLEAVAAVLASWTSPSARAYRRLNGLDDATGTGVLIQAMVFGNSGPRSGSGVAFTRDPATGNPGLYVDFASNGQGEDVVAGRLPVAGGARLPALLPAVWAQLQSARSLLEREFRDMQDLEFTVDDGRLFYLQTRPGKRTPWAALRIATDLVREGVLDEATAVERLAPYDLDAIRRVVVAPGPLDRPIAQAIPASVGVATGAVVFDAARTRDPGGRPTVLLRSELTTDDIAGLAAAAGVLTTFGGRTSHAAVVARQLGKVCLVGCASLRCDEGGRSGSLGGRRLREGDEITLDGESGVIYDGRVPVVTERPVEDLALVRRWRTRQAPPEALTTAEGTGPA